MFKSLKRYVTLQCSTDCEWKTRVKLFNLHFLQAVLYPVPCTMTTIIWLEDSNGTEAHLQVIPYLSFFYDLPCSLFGFCSCCCWIWRNELVNNLWLWRKSGGYEHYVIFSRVMVVSLIMRVSVSFVALGFLLFSMALERFHLSMALPF